MTKHFYFAVFALLFATQAFSQGFDPKILVLSPGTTKSDKSFEKEIATQDKNIQEYFAKEAYAPDEHKDRTENVQLIYKAEHEFVEKPDFFKMTSYITEQHLLYVFYERFKNVLILLKDAKSTGEKSDLKRIAVAEQMQFVVNIKSVELYKEKKKPCARIGIQLYDQESGEILLDQIYGGNSENPGFEFTCKEGSINCCINNAIAKGLDDVIRLIATNNPTLKREKQLASDRTDVLLNMYFEIKPEKELLAAIIPASDKKIELESVYRTIFNEDKTKFVAFFAEPVPADGKAFMDGKDDKRKNIISQNEMDIFSGKYPNTYAHIVKGVKYNGKWYYEKSDVTYFDAEDILAARKEFFVKLQKWNFFKENSTARNPEFWETKLFAKVIDLTKDPEWEKNGATIWQTNEVNDRPYIGMYEIVAERLKEEKEEKDKIMEKVLNDKYIQPYIAKLKLMKKYETVVSADKMIYPTDERAVLCPLKVNEKDKEKVILYLLLVKQNDGMHKLYEWNYLKQENFPAEKWGPKFMDQLNTITEWNFSYDRLDDEKFWNDYVLVKAGSDYKYLKEVK